MVSFGVSTGFYASLPFYSHERLLLCFLVCGIIIWSILYFPQFTALYPEMVDALILLDTVGLLPTDAVRTSLTPYFAEERYQFVW